MPQASEELRKRWKGPDQTYAIHYLRSRGYRLMPGFEWLIPLAETPTEKDCSAVQFLFEEWDFGGMTHLDVTDDGVRLPTLMIDHYTKGSTFDVARFDSRLRPITVALYPEGFVHIGKYKAPSGAMIQLAMATGAWS